ncbi:MAG: AAA family ATPase [Rhodanobacter sp.]
MRILVFGNSGSGKSTLCRDLASTHALHHLDLDSIVWEPGQVAVQRPMGSILTALDDFLDTHASWAIEGCYGELVEHASTRCTRLVLLNPGRETCLRQSVRRPWEPHKYASPEAQDAMLANLQAWVSSYHERSDPWSFAAHRALFDAFSGSKVEYTKPTTAMVLVEQLP